MLHIYHAGLWGEGSPFTEGFEQFRGAVEAGKLGMMELVAMHLRKEGVYTCRTLSFAGCKVVPFLDSLRPFSLFSYIYSLLNPPIVWGCQMTLFSPFFLFPHVLICSY